MQSDFLDWWTVNERDTYCRDRNRDGLSEIQTIWEAFLRVAFRVSGRNVRRWCVFEQASSEAHLSDKEAGQTPTLKVSQKIVPRPRCSAREDCGTFVIVFLLWISRCWCGTRIHFQFLRRLLLCLIHFSFLEILRIMNRALTRAFRFYMGASSCLQRSIACYLLRISVNY